MLDQESAKCDEWQLNLVSSLLVSREILPLSSSECRFQWKHEPVHGGQGSASSTLLQGLLFGIRSAWSFMGWGEVALHLRACRGISRRTCGSNIRRIW